MGLLSATVPLEIIKILKDNGVNINRVFIFKNITHYKDILLKDIKDYKINMDYIIQKNTLNPFYKIGTKINALIELYNNENARKRGISEEEKKTIEELDLYIVKRNRHTKSIELLEMLDEYGADLSRFIKKGHNSYGILLKDINLSSGDINELIDVYDLNPNQDIGCIIKNLKNHYYKENEKSGMTEEQKRKVENLGIVNEQKVSSISRGGQLSEKEKEQQMLNNRLEQAKRLRNEAQKATDKIQK